MFWLFLIAICSTDIYMELRSSSAVNGRIHCKYITTISMCVFDELIVCGKSCLSSGCVHIGRSFSPATVMQLPTYSGFLFVACDLNNCYEMTLS
jgi:hypothetical protein